MDLPQYTYTCSPAIKFLVKRKINTLWSPFKGATWGQKVMHMVVNVMICAEHHLIAQLRFYSEIYKCVYIDKNCCFSHMHNLISDNYLF